jgi:hypothetical protein
MTDLVVIVPSRARPDAAAALIETFQQTCTADTGLLFAVDDNDPTLEEYQAAADRDWVDVVVVGGDPKNMVHALNVAAARSVEGGPFAVGFMGDDHRPRTRGWDLAYIDALRQLGTGIVFGDDLLQSERLPTQCAMTADIVRELGYMSPPSLIHMYVDNFWLSLGRQAECIKYLPDVVIEHVHPAAGKVGWDEGHVRVNAPNIYAADELAFSEYCRTSLDIDVKKIRSLCAAAPHAVATPRADTASEQKAADRARLRPAHSAQALAGIYATPHQHAKWADHKVRVAVTAQFAHALVGKVAKGADLSCGDGTILSSMDVGERFFGDFAPGYPLTGPVDDTIEQIPHVDLFVSTETIEHLDDPDQTLKLIRGKASTLILSTPVDAFQDTNPEHYWAWSRAGVETMLTDAGFTVVAYCEVDFRPSGGEYSFGVWYCR